MNTITRTTIPALLLGLSGLALSTASQADSSFSITISSGFPAPYASYVYHDSYRPYARACNPYRRPPVHRDVYVEKHIYRDYARPRGHHAREKYREHRRRDRHEREEYEDRYERRHHTGYARISYY